MNPSLINSTKFPHRHFKSPVPAVCLFTVPEVKVSDLGYLLALLVLGAVREDGAVISPHVVTRDCSLLTAPDTPAPLTYVQWPVVHSWTVREATHKIIFYF